MEQISCLKLKHIGLALEKGVNVMLMDLDLGFLRDPMLLTEGFFENPLEQVRTQMDVGYSQHKTMHYWYTHPRPNFGLFIVKPTEWSIKLFARAWRLYKNSDQSVRQRVATDQNYLANAIKWARWRSDFNFSYFDIGHPLDTKPRPVLAQQAVLLDKTKERSPRGIAFELGGDVARGELKDAIAVHATCYEGQTKLLALKAANAFNNPFYYDPNRRTLTKPLMHVTPDMMYKEIATLTYIAIKTNRTLILPNVLLGSGARDEVLGQPSEEACGGASGGRPKEKKVNNPHFGDSSMESEMATGQFDIKRSFFCRETTRRLLFYAYRMLKQSPSHAVKVGHEWYWPGFRVINNELDALKVVEPGYYAKTKEVLARNKGHQAHKGKTVPAPYLLDVDIGHRPGHAGMQQGVNELLELLQQADVQGQPRVVLDVYDSRFGPYASGRSGFPGGKEALAQWAEGSHSSWTGAGDTLPADEQYQHPPIDKALYVSVPPLSTLMNTLSLDLDNIGALQPQSDLAHGIFEDVTLCKNFLKPVQGNRTCFATCK